MQTGRSTRLKLRLESYLFIALLLAAVGLLGWLSTRHGFESDWTASGRNSLSDASRQLLTSLDQPLRITAFARPDEMLRGRIEDLINRYRRVKSDLQLEMVNPDTAPQRVRELDVTVDGTLLVEYQGRSEKVLDLNEQALTNALQRLARSGERWVVFLQGHGERRPDGNANHDLGHFARELERKGITVQSLNLGTTPAIPLNTTVLVIAGPQTDLLPGEVTLMRGYLENGGNLLWLADPEPLHGLEPLAQQLGIGFVPGVIVDATARLFGIQSPDIALVPQYPDHGITRDFQLMTLFPRAAALSVDAPEGWEAAAFLNTAPSTWAETGALEGEIRRDAGEQAGPLTVGIALNRAVDNTDPATADAAREQRVVVIGDGDFLANAYLGNAGNLDLGMAILNWLNHDDALIAIPAKTSPDVDFALGRVASAAIGFGFLLLLPLLLIGSGVVIWLRRRRR
ncbi:MAG: ABC transporter [Proteobacteria bacterium]|nr:MAG: ABC transporter [Pseudomonadota bacterium]QKK10392.1 MAG: GldG family protein [Pseudomonadota bacterium]